MQLAKRKNIVTEITDLEFARCPIFWKKDVIADYCWIRKFQQWNARSGSTAPALT